MPDHSPAITIKCPICSSADMFLEEVNDSYLVYSCQACGARFAVEYPLHAKDAENTVRR
jgi:hypothetical protein